MSRIGLIDYGMGNIHSVKKAIENLGKEVLLVGKKSEINSCQALIIPGQGAFDPAIENLRKTELIEDIKNWITGGKPFLGICLGLQLLFENSEEGKNHGLNIISGKITKIPQIDNQRIPHIGWCNLIPTKESTLLNKNDSNNWVYFDHSYYAVPKDKDFISANVKYGNIYLTAIIEHENLTACQFHPEKSGKVGENLLRKWINNIK